MNLLIWLGSECILQIALMAPIHPNLFILKVQEVGGWVNMSTEMVNENYFSQFININEINENYFSQFINTNEIDKNYFYEYINIFDVSFN